MSQEIVRKYYFEVCSISKNRFVSYKEGANIEADGCAKQFGLSEKRINDAADAMSETSSKFSYQYECRVDSFVDERSNTHFNLICQLKTTLKTKQD